jgi:hypothetical protein
MGLRISEQNTTVEEAAKKIWATFIELTTKFSLPFIPEKDLEIKVSEPVEKFNADIEVTCLKCKKPKESYLFHALIKNGEKEVATIHYVLKPAGISPFYTSP